MINLSGMLIIRLNSNVRTIQDATADRKNLLTACSHEYLFFMLQVSKMGKKQNRFGIHVVGDYGTSRKDELLVSFYTEKEIKEDQYIPNYMDSWTKEIEVDSNKVSNFKFEY